MKDMLGIFIPIVIGIAASAVIGPIIPVIVLALYLLWYFEKGW